MGAAAPIALAAVGSTLGVIGAIRQGNTEKAAGDFNAQLAEENAAQAQSQAQEEERRHRISSKKTIGDIRASIGASGVTLEGSPEDILAESAANAELDALNIRHKGALRGSAFREEAKLQRFYGKQARTAGYIQAGAIGANAAAKATAGGG